MENVPPLKPVNGRLLVVRKDPEKTTKGGLVIPQRAEKAQQVGTIVAVADDVYYPEGVGEGLKVNLDFQPGNDVLFGKYGGAEVEYDGVNYLLLRFEEVYCIIQEPKAEEQAA